MSFNLLMLAPPTFKQLKLYHLVKYFYNFYSYIWCDLQTGRRIYVFGGYRLEDEQLYVPRVEYYHTKKKRWFPTFSLMTFDNESFREVDVHILQVPNANQNFKVLTTAYKYPLW